MIDVRGAIGTHDVLFITLDTLRHDVAAEEMAAGRTPVLQRWLGAWEPRHSPGSFTFAAHQAFFAGFLPTPVQPGQHPRLFALAFPGAETIGERTCVLDAPDIVTGLKDRGYHTICIGGTGFFNRRTPLGKVIPNLFEESHWSEALSVTNPDSTREQVELALTRLKAAGEQRVLLFVNISALHQPNTMYLDPPADQDGLASHAAALRYVDRELEPLFSAMHERAPTLAIVCSDHGTAYGEDGYRGHRVAHPAVWTVPYAEAVLGGAAS